MCQDQNLSVLDSNCLLTSGPPPARVCPEEAGVHPINTLGLESPRQGEGGSGPVPPALTGCLSARNHALPLCYPGPALLQGSGRALLDESDFPDSSQPRGLGLLELSLEFKKAATFTHQVKRRAPGKVESPRDLADSLCPLPEGEQAHPHHCSARFSHFVPSENLLL